MRRLIVVTNLMDIQYDDMPRVGMYRAALAPELYPGERPMLVWNWPRQDVEMFCGVVTYERN